MIPNVSTPRRLALFLLILAACFASTSIPAAQSVLKGPPELKMYLQVDGISGEVKDTGFENAIEILAYSWGASQSGSVVGPGSGVGKANLQDVSLTKFYDTSTPPLLLALFKGTHLPKATLTLVRTVNGAPDKFLTIVLTELIVTSVSTGGSIGQAADTLTENITLNFAKIKITYKAADGTVSEVSWDAATNTGS